MKRLPLNFPIALFACASLADAAVTLTISGVAPVTGAGDQFQLGNDAPIPGGSYNSQAFSDNAGPPGQTFTTAAGSNFTLDAFSFMGAAAGSPNFGGFTGTTTWGIRLSQVSGTTLTPLLTVTNIANPTGITGNEWFTWTFSGAEQLTLLPTTTYAFEVFSSAGYLGFDAAVSPASYTGGVAFNNAGSQRTFDSTTLQDRGYDRTFVADVSAVPEPASALFLFAGLGLLGQRRRR